MKKILLLIAILILAGCKYRDYAISVVDTTTGKVIYKSCVVGNDELPEVRYDGYSHVPYISCRNGNIAGYNRLVIHGFKTIETDN